MSHSISLNDASAMTAFYRLNQEAILDTTYKGQDVLPTCETFDLEAITDIIEQSGCTGLRIYYGMDEEYKLHAILVGVNGSDEDMLPSSGTEETDMLAERGIRCPDICPPRSALNS